MKQTYWIWYPGDFEIYHGMEQNFSREERGFDWPAYWYISDCRKNVKFQKVYQLKEKTSFTVYSYSHGYILVNGKKHRYQEEIICEPGEAKIEIFAGLMSGVPSVFIEGELIHSDTDWFVTDLCSEEVKAGYSPLYARKEQNPTIWEYSRKWFKPITVSEINGGVLYDFERELDGVIHFSCKDDFRPFTLCYGESDIEAKDVEMCYYSQKIITEHDDVRRRAFRYVFVPDCKKDDIHIQAEHYYVDIPVKAEFSSSDTLMNKVWQVSKETFQLCSGMFFVDGIKRDRWVWSGDAYQSYFVNQYLMFDEEINKRTIWALRGNDPVRQHINTIVDYSMYWITSIFNHYQMSGDIEFLRTIYPKMKTMMLFLESQLDEHGFIVGRGDDWIFIDWSEMDKTGPLCAEQMLLAMSYKTMSTVEKVLHYQSVYQNKFKKLMDQMNQYYWSEDKGAYIDSFTSGKNHVTRHANIFAILFDFADEMKKQQIYENVICNETITKITTPYFKFYELEVLSKLGKYQDVMEQIKEYWGGILNQGAVTIWEEYDPAKSGDAHYEMYGDPYGKSLCHAWGASPIYLIGRYFMGVRPTEAGYQTFEIRPDITTFESFHCTVPIKDGYVRIDKENKKLKVVTNREGGNFVFGEEQILLKSEMEYVLDTE